MADLALAFLSAGELATLIRRRSVSPVEAVEAVLARIEALDARLRAFCLVRAEEARAEARAAEAAVRRGEPLGPLHGVPVSVKDMLLTRGIRTTFGSALHADLVPAEDAPAVARLRAAGAILLGKTATPEFGYKAVTDSRLFGPTRNPWDPARTPSGSSGGAAVAVATGMGPVALGTDAGGSIRAPAAACGVAGLKPTFGRVALRPLAGWEALSYRLEHHGPLARTVADLALVLDVIAGPAPDDPTALPPPAGPFAAGLERGVAGLRVAWSPDLNGAVAAPEVRAVAEAAARRFADLGCHVEAATPVLPPLHDAYRRLFAADCAAALAHHLPAWRERLDGGLVRLVELGQGVAGAEYARLRNATAAAAAELGRFFARYDLLLTPTLPLAPWPLGVDWPREVAGQRIHPLGVLAYTYPFNLSGQPAASVPCGMTAEGLPVGLQIVGRRFEEGTVLRAAAAFEALAPRADRRPPA